MENKSYFFGTLFIVFFSAFSLMAQNIQYGTRWQAHDGAISTDNYFIQEQNNLGLNSPDEMQLVQTIASNNGWNHYKYKQFYQGLEVLASTYILHEKNGLVKKANGSILPDIQESIQPAITLETAKSLVENEVLMGILSDQKLTVDNYNEFTPIYKKGRLCIADKSYPLESGQYTLAWIFEMDHQSWPPQVDEYVVNAKTGDIISRISKIHYESIEVEVETKYYGFRKIIMDSIGPQEYFLRDLTRGGGIVTHDGFTDELYQSEDPFDWIKHEFEYEVATDVHFCMEEYYDFMLNTFNWKSYDNKDSEMKSTIHARPNASFVNAYWTGDQAFFGDGDCNSYTPLTSLDVVAHEFTHGFTQSTSNLIYANESGGLNESMSDIFGKMSEYYTTPNEFSWELGGTFARDSSTRNFRSLKDPNKYNNPKYYKGKFWANQVHNMSGVQNYWFYLISDGEKGKNEKNKSYNVKAIGKDKAIQIVFLMQTVYLTPNSTYRDAVNASIEATKDLYGDGGPEMKAVLAAWKAVGLEAPDVRDLDMTIQIVSPEIGANGTSSFCEYEPIEVVVELENIGRNDIGKDSIIGLELRNNGKVVSEGSLTLDSTLVPGASILYTFPDLLSLKGMGGRQITLNARFILDDDNKQNNNQTLRFSLLRNIEGKDLAITNILQLRGKTCIQEDSAAIDLAYLLQIANRGCESMLKGDIIDVRVTLNGVVIDTNIVVPFDLQPGANQYIRLEFPVDISAGWADMEVLLNNAWDKRKTNNKRKNKRFVSRAVELGYEENFADYDPAFAEHISFTLPNILYRTVEYNGDEMIAISTRRNADLNSLQKCGEVPRFFNSNQKSGSIDWCVELSDLVIDPKFEFDMVQFNSKNKNFTANPDYQTIVRLTLIDDPNFEPVYYYGQEQGEIVHYSVPLPLEYSGGVQMETYTAFGSKPLFDRGEFEKIDAVLLDNITITGLIVSNNNIERTNAVYVYPNPSYENFMFTTKSTEETLMGSEIQIVDLMGKVVLQKTLEADRYNWITQGMQPGIYLYNIQKQGQRIAQGRVVLAR